MKNEALGGSQVIEACHMAKQRKRAFGLLGRGGKFWEVQGKKSMISKGSLAMQTRVFQVVRVFSLIQRHLYNGNFHL